MQLTLDYTPKLTDIGSGIRSIEEKKRAADSKSPLAARFNFYTAPESLKTAEYDPVDDDDIYRSVFSLVMHYLILGTIKILRFVFLQSWCYAVGALEQQRSFDFAS